MKSSWKNTGGSQIVPASSPSQQLQWFRCAVPRIRLRHDQIGRRCVVHSYFLEECDDGSCQRQTEVTVPRQSLKTCLVGGRCSVQSTRRERVAHRWQENTHPCAAWLQFVCVCALSPVLKPRFSFAVTWCQLRHIQHCDSVSHAQVLQQLLGDPVAASVTRMAK